MTHVEKMDELAPVVLGTVEELTAGDKTGYSDSGSGHKDAGGSINSAPYVDLPRLSL